MTANHLHAYAKFQEDPIINGKRAEVCRREEQDANGARRGDPPPDEDGAEVLEARDGPPADEEGRGVRRILRVRVRGDGNASVLSTLGTRQTRRSDSHAHPRLGPPLILSQH